MNPIVDTIILVAFVCFLIYLVAGFNKQQVEKHNKKMDEREKQKNNQKK
jgi:hypothetical protein